MHKPISVATNQTIASGRKAHSRSRPEQVCGGAGATLSGDKETRGDAAKAAATALNVGLNITESVARKFGLKSHVEMREEARARAEAAAKERSPPPTPEE